MVAIMDMTQSHRK